MRQQVSEPQKHFPPCGCTRESTIETAIEHEVFPHIVIQRPQVPDGIAPEKRLSEMPYFSGDSKVSYEGVRNRDCLPELGAVNRVVDDFVEEKIGVVVKAFYVRACKKEH